MARDELSPGSSRGGRLQQADACGTGMVAGTQLLGGSRGWPSMPLTTGAAFLVTDQGGCDEDGAHPALVDVLVWVGRSGGRLGSLDLEDHASLCCGSDRALGRHLVPGLVAAGHEVTGTTRTPGKVAQLREVGAKPVVVDGLDREAVIAAVRAGRLEVIVHQMTALADMRSLRKPDTTFAVTNELRTRGTDSCWRPRRGRAPAGSSRKATSPCTSLPAAR
jgi:hypothetical protein